MLLLHVREYRCYSGRRKSNMANIREVAKKAGVATATVSRYLNGTAYVNEEKKQKIEQAMRELNYIPNELARSMFKGKANTIGMLVPKIEHPWFSSLASSIEEILFLHGYKLMLLGTSDNAAREKDCINVLRSNIVDGIICGTSACEKEVYESIDKPVVMLDFKVNDSIPLVVSDHEEGGKLAAEELVRSGCRYAIHVCGMNDSADIYSYRSHVAFDRIMEEAGVRSRKVPIRWNDFDFPGYRDMAKLILEQYPEIDGIMAADLPAIAFAKAALQLGRKIPDDFKVVAYDGTFLTESSIINLTRIRQPYEDIAKEATDLLFKEIDQDGPAPFKPSPEIILPVKLIKGETT
jgi:LacI family sucrose operon transcriptional repressor